VNEAIAGIDVNQAVKVFGEKPGYYFEDITPGLSKTEDGPGDDGCWDCKNLGQPELQIKLDMQKMALYGITAAEANAEIELAIGVGSHPDV
jgi:cobalt-zinc-cadmium resistance protein CzcA